MSVFLVGDLQPNAVLEFRLHSAQAPLDQQAFNAPSHLEVLVHCDRFEVALPSELAL